MLVGDKKKSVVSTRSSSLAVMTARRIEHLFITLKRGLAGKKTTHVKTAAALGLRGAWKTVVQPNNPAVRGAIDKIKHMVLVETDVSREERLKGEAARGKLAKVTVPHSG